MAFDPVSSIFDFAGKAIDKIFPNKDEADKAKLRMLELEKQGQMEELKTEASLLIQQMAINSDEAKHASWFVAGWRPFIGWICGTVLAVYYIPRALMCTTLWVIACAKANWVIVAYPSMDISELMQLLVGMLGLGILRSWEKSKKNGNGK